MNEELELENAFFTFIIKHYKTIKFVTPTFELDTFKNNFIISRNDFLLDKKRIFRIEFIHIFLIKTILEYSTLFSENAFFRKIDLLKAWFSEYEFFNMLDELQSRDILNFIQINYKNSLKDKEIIDKFVFILSYRNTDNKEVLKFIQEKYFLPLITKENKKNELKAKIIEKPLEEFKKNLKNKSILDNLNKLNKFYWNKVVFNKYKSSFKHNKDKIEIISLNKPVSNNNDTDMINNIQYQEQENDYNTSFDTDEEENSNEINSDNYDEDGNLSIELDLEEKFEENITKSTSMFEKTIFEIIISNEEDYTKKICYLFLSSISDENKSISEALGTSDGTITNISKSLEVDFIYLLNRTLDLYLSETLKDKPKEFIIKDFYNNELEDYYNDKNKLIEILNSKSNNLSNSEGIIKVLQAIKIRDFIRTICKEFGISTKFFREELILKMQDSEPKIWKNYLLMENQLNAKLEKAGINISKTRVKEIAKNLKLFGKDITRVIYDDSNIIKLESSYSFYDTFTVCIREKLNPSKKFILKNLFSDKYNFYTKEVKDRNKILFNFFTSFKYEKASNFIITSNIGEYGFKVFNSLAKKEYFKATAEYLKDEICLEIKDIYV